MKMQFFSIPVLDPESAGHALNVFLASHHVVQVDRQFVADGAGSMWSVCVSYIDGEGRPEPEKRQKRIDYREVLPAHEFAVFDKLRTLRKELADAEGVAAYNLFTNKQLADMIRRRIVSLAGLKSLDGVGDGRVEKYGKAFLRILRQEIPALDNGAAVSEDHETNGDSA
ncbi:HRDC domain-containing protein [Candidatus Entotheonella palauensis]|uniref:HRDC domain-containing protein n=1 Tax=Candidatus Entotheonella palauensis TaxID=93172 RepID=UPI000B7F4588|nr:HRDC domain-containing protein [Candidatus Entotheonella palauensis]